MSGFAVWALRREGILLKKHLAGEVELGTFSSPQYQTAVSSLNQTMAAVNALFGKNYRATVTFYQLCGELAHKKEQLLSLGDETGNRLIIQSLRSELTRLSPGALTFVPRASEVPRRGAG
jgi:hypothetical protein